LQIFIEVALLLDEAESQPLRKHLMMTVTERTVGVLVSQEPRQRFVAIAPGGGVAQ